MTSLWQHQSCVFFFRPDRAAAEPQKTLHSQSKQLIQVKWACFFFLNQRVHSVFYLLSVSVKYIIWGHLFICYSCPVSWDRSLIAEHLNSAALKRRTLSTQDHDGTKTTSSGTKRGLIRSREIIKLLRTPQTLQLFNVNVLMCWRPPENLKTADVTQ